MFLVYIINIFNDFSFIYFISFLVTFLGKPYIIQAYIIEVFTSFPSIMISINLKKLIQKKKKKYKNNTSIFNISKHFKPCNLLYKEKTKNEKSFMDKDLVIGLQVTP